MTQWIPCKDSLPTEEQEVLVFIKRITRLNRLYYHLQVACLIDGEWSTDDCYTIYGDVTHWMPLPEPPTEIY